MKTRMILTAFLLGLAAAGSAQDGASTPVGEKLLRGAKGLRLQALPGDAVYAGPHATLLDPATGSAVPRLVIANPATACVPVLHQHRRGEYAMYWLLFGEGPAAGRPRKELGSHSDPVVIRDDFARVADAKRTRFRMTTRDDRTVVREYTSDALIAYTRHDSAVRMDAGDGPGRKTAASYNEKGEEIGSSPAGSVRITAVTLTPNPVKTGMPVSIRVEWRNDTPDPVGAALLLMVKPHDGAFSKGGTRHVEPVTVPSGASSTNVSDVLIPKHSGEVPLLVDFTIGRDGKGLWSDQMAGGTSILSQGPLVDVRGAARLADGSTRDVPATLSEAGRGSAVSSGGGGDDLRRWARAGTGAAMFGLFTIDWLAKPEDGGDDLKLSTVTPVYADGAAEAVDRAMAHVTWRPADQDPPPAAPEGGCRYAISETPGRTGTLTYELFAQLDKEDIIIRAPQQALPVGGYTTVGKLDVTFRADGTLEARGEVTEARGQKLNLSFTESNQRTIHLKHVPGDRCVGDHPPRCEPTTDGSVGLSSQINHEKGGGGATSFVSHSKLWTVGITPDATREVSFEGYRQGGSDLYFMFKEPTADKAGETKAKVWYNTLKHQGVTFSSGDFHVKNTIEIKISGLTKMTTRFNGTCQVRTLSLTIGQDCHK